MPSLQRLAHLTWKPLAAIQLSLISIVASLPPAAQAQYGSIPTPNSQGDYESAFMLGNLGYYGNEKWLILDTDMLNCRWSPDGDVRSQILPGAIVTAIFKLPASPKRLTEVTPEMDAIVLSPTTNNPWLHIKGTATGLAVPPFPNAPWQTKRPHKPGECYIRANRRYIAPINVDARLK